MAAVTAATLAATLLLVATLLTPASASAATPATTPADTLATTPATTLATTPATTPATTLATTLADAPVATLATTPVARPVATPATTPADAPVTTPVATLATLLAVPPSVAVAAAAPNSTSRSNQTSRPSAPRAGRFSTLTWPAGTKLIPFENLEGVILITARLQGRTGRDTTGPFALDTGAGFLALGHELAIRLGIADSTLDRTAVDFAPLPLPRIEFGTHQIDQVSPVLTADLDLVQRVTDRPVLGLLGAGLYSAAALGIDYQDELVALVPVGVGPLDDGPGSGPTAGDRGTATDSRSRRRLAARVAARAAASRAALESGLASRSIAIPFEIAGDGKLLVRVRLSNPRPPHYSDWLNLVIDTGATKCVLFEDALDRDVPQARLWPALAGIAVPTLLGVSGSRVVRIPSLEIEGLTRGLIVSGVDAAVMRSDLSDVLTRVVGRTVHGLLGYSFLKRHRVVIDYPHQVMWLERLPGGWDDHPNEYSHVGLQLERAAGVVRVLAAAESSPAAKAGITAGDEIVAVDDRPVAGLDVLEISSSLEGSPGTRVRVTIRRGTSERTLVLVRRRLL